MKKILFSSILAVMALSANASDDFTAVRGVNIDNWLSQIGNNMPKYEWYDEAEIKQLADWGFDHIRLCVGEEKIYLNCSSSKFQELGYQEWEPQKNDACWNKIHDIIGYCQKYGLKVIFDLHECPIWNVNHADVNGALFEYGKTEEARKHFYRLWSEFIPEELSQYPNDLVAYELLNEPNTIAKSQAPQLWNEIASEAIRLIREKEPNRTIIVDGNFYANLGDYFTQLRLTLDEGESHVWTSVHFYEPNIFGFYGLDNHPIYDCPIHYPGVTLVKEEWDDWYNNWTPLGKKHCTNKPGDRSGWCGQSWDQAKIEDRIRACKEHAESIGTKLYVGEVGSPYFLPKEDRIRWYTDFVKSCDNLDLGYANWGYKTCMGLYEWNGRRLKSDFPNNLFSTDLNDPNEELIQALTHNGAGVDPITISDVDSNAPVEWYNLEGVKVLNPTKGVYIRRQGSTVQKVIL